MAPLHLADQSTPVPMPRASCVRAAPWEQGPQNGGKILEAVDRTARSWCGLDVLKLIFYFQDATRLLDLYRYIEIDNDKERKWF